MKLGPRTRAVVLLASLLTAAGLASACYKSRGDAAAPELEARIATLEQYIAKHSEALAFLAKVWEQQQRQAAAEEEDEPAPDAVFGVAIADDVKAGMVEGPATALVTIVKAFDFACPYCMRTSALMTELVKEYGGEVRVVYKNLVVHRDTAMAAHLASCAAARQGKYLAYKTAFWTRGFEPYQQSGGRDKSSLEPANLLAIARELGLDTTRFKTDMDGASCKALIDGDMAELARFRVGGTPAFFINGHLVAGGIPKDEMKAIIDARLVIARASGVPGAQYYDREVLAKGEKQFRSKKSPKPTR